MRFKKLIIIFLIITFCSSEKTQADLCDDYLYFAEYQIETIFDKTISDFLTLAGLHVENKIDKKVVYAQMTGEFTDEIEKIRTDITDLIPNEANRSSHNLLIKSLIKIEEGFGFFGSGALAEDSSVVETGLTLVGDGQRELGNAYRDIKRVCLSEQD